MGKRAKQPVPLVDRELGPNRRLVVREALGNPLGAFVATVRYDTPPYPGHYVLLIRYGKTAEEAESRALEAFYV